MDVGNLISLVFGTVALLTLGNNSLGWNTFTVHTMEQNRTEQNRTEQNRKFLSDNIEYILLKSSRV